MANIQKGRDDDELIEVDGKQGEDEDFGVKIEGGHPINEDEVENADMEAMEDPSGESEDEVVEDDFGDGSEE